ncbi:MAG: hypothetical protein ACT4PL_07175 [Phycisphaerales bacterium]
MATARRTKRAAALVAPAALFAFAGLALAQDTTGSNACGTANTVGVGTYAGSTTNATNDGATNCGSSTTARDMWYRFTAATSGILTAQTCGTGTTYDSVLSLHSACPGTSANTLACNDDACGSASRVTRNMAAGETLLIRVAGFSTARGNYSLALSFADAPPPPPPPPASTSGPDVTIGTLVDVGRFGTNGNGAITAYAVGTDSCNRGDIPVAWYDTGPRAQEHPVIAQAMYRYKIVNGAGRFEQLGQSWLKHGFASTNSNACGTCQQPPGGGSELGVNCSDTYGSGLNGGQSFLGPRSQVNAVNGAFPWPHGTGSGTDGTSGSTVGMRLQVPTADVTGTTGSGANVGAQYWVDAHYVTMDDARWLRPNTLTATNGLNNLSYRKINIQNGTGTPSFIGGTVQQLPGIFAWRDVDPLITLIPIDYPEPHPTNPNARITGRFWVGAKATPIANGMWHYEYAVFNLNSDRSAQQFIVPLPANAAFSNFEFRHPRSHSGEAYSNDAWTPRREGNQLIFETQTFATNANANAIRWSTLYNFRFDTDAAPNFADGTITLFKPALNGNYPAAINVPNIPMPIVPPVCLADINGDGILSPDDLDDYITCYFNVPPCPLADTNFNGIVSPDDLDNFITTFFNGCN